MTISKKSFDAAGKAIAGKKSAKSAKSATTIDVVDMKGNVVAKVARLACKLGTLKTKSATKAAEARLVEWRVSALDTKAHAWCAGMRVAYYAECLCYWNEVAMQLDGWGLDVRRIDCDMWNGLWVAWGRGVTQAKLVKKLFAAGYGRGGQTQKDAKGVASARTKSERDAEVNKLLGL